MWDIQMRLALCSPASMWATSTRTVYAFTSCRRIANLTELRDFPQRMPLRLKAHHRLRIRARSPTLLNKGPSMSISMSKFTILTRSPSLMYFIPLALLGAYFAWRSYA
jgi:hypothetical protein